MPNPQSLTLPQALQLATQSFQKGELHQAERLCRQILPPRGSYPYRLLSF